jgi:hypothetical protein
VRHGVRHFCSIYPAMDLFPNMRVTMQHAGDLVKRYVGALKHIGDFGHRA